MFFFFSIPVFVKEIIFTISQSLVCERKETFTKFRCTKIKSQWSSIPTTKIIDLDVHEFCFIKGV